VNTRRNEACRLLKYFGGAVLKLIRPWCSNIRLLMGDILAHSVYKLILLHRNSLQNNVKSPS